MESLLFETANVTLGSLHCAASDEAFRKPASWPRHTFVFPRTVTRIERHSEPAITAAPTGVLLYNRGQRYSRRPVHGADVSDWLVLRDSWLASVLSPYERRVDPDEPFRFAEAAPGGRMLLMQRMLWDELSRGDALDELHVEETVLAIVRAVLRAGYVHPKRGNPTLAEMDGIEIAREWIARNPEANPSLAELSARAGMQPLRFCRFFNLRTGLSVTAYKHRLRACLALDLGKTSNYDLGEIAALLGYSSHSHFTRAFRRVFGIAPSFVRGQRAFARYCTPVQSSPVEIAAF